jgi:hypothetical protein
MCVHKYYIFKRCGHSFFDRNLLVACNLATIAVYPLLTRESIQDNTGKMLNLEETATQSPKSSDPRAENDNGKFRSQWRKSKRFSSACRPRAFAYTSYNIEKLCSGCERRRSELLEVAEENIKNAEGRQGIKSPTMESDDEAGSTGFWNEIADETASNNFEDSQW